MKALFLLFLMGTAGAEDAGLDKPLVLPKMEALMFLVV